jgi:quercetin dioxygenase-like cupin family protein
MSEVEGNKEAIRPQPGGLLAVTINDEIERIKSSPELAHSGRHGVSLVKDKALNVLLMVLKKGIHLHSHQTKGPIAVQVLSGKIRFVGGDQERALSAGMLLGLDREVPHSVEALEDAAILLITAIA